MEAIILYLSLDHSRGSSAFHERGICNVLNSHSANVVTHAQLHLLTLDIERLHLAQYTLSIIKSVKVPFTYVYLLRITVEHLVCDPCSELDS